VVKIDDTLLAIWFMHVSAWSNWVCLINQEPNGALLHQWRMRYFPPGSGLFDEDETSSWYRGVTEQPISEVVEKIRTAVRILSEHADGPVCELLRGDRPADAFHSELIAQQWIHFRRRDAQGFDVTFKLLDGMAQLRTSL
jgi:hypothetical protein